MGAISIYGLLQKTIKYYIRDSKAVLLDFDGTLIPSEHVFAQAWINVFQNEFNCKFTEDEYIEYELENNAMLIDYLIAKKRINGNISKNNYMSRVYDYYDTQYLLMLEATDFFEVLNHIRIWNNFGLKLGIVSTSKKKYIDLFFDRYNEFSSMFSCILCREDVEKLKPHPMVYNMAAHKIGINNSQCLVVEDSYKGVVGALAAGISVVRVKKYSLWRKNIHNKDIVEVDSLNDIVCR